MGAREKLSSKSTVNMFAIQYYENVCLKKKKKLKYNRDPSTREVCHSKRIQTDKLIENKHEWTLKLMYV